MNRTETDGASGNLVSLRQLARLPLLTIMTVFIPVILTALTYKLMGPQSRAAMTTSPMIPFLVYAAWNWFVICGGYLLIRRSGITWKNLGFTNFRFRDMGLAVAGALIGLFVVYPIATWLARILGLAAMRGMNYSLIGPLDIVSALVACVLIGPLAEDIIFRGYLLNMLRARIANLWIVGFIGVVMFTLVHLPYFGWGGMLFIFLWTPFTVGLFLWRRSIYPSYVMHVLNNFFAYMIVPLFLR
jgi:membrane protease YdiL (CAAX protease family)